MGKVVPIVAGLAGAAVAGPIGIGLLNAGIGLSAGAGILAGQIGGFVVSTAVNQLGSRLFTKKPKTPSLAQDAQGRTIMVRSSVDTHKIIYGQARVSGPLVFVKTVNDGNDSNGVFKRGTNRFLHMVIPLAGHEVEEIGTVYFNDQPVTIYSDGFVRTSPYDQAGISYARVFKHLGGADQLADEDLRSECGLADTHRLRGIAYLYVRLEFNPDAFPLGIPNISAVVKGKKVYDPRDGGQSETDAATWEWADNAALCVRDYLLNECAVATTRFDDAYTTAAANVCDESVTLSTGGSQDRYTCNGVIDTGAARRENLAALLSSMAGAVVRVGSDIRISAGAYDSPSGTITDSLLVDAINLRARTPRSELVNTVRGTYVDPNRNWQATDFPPVTSATYLTQDNGQEYSRDLDLPFTNHPEAAQRIAKIILGKARQGIAAEVTLNHSALQYACWDTVSVTQSDLGWTSKVFRVTQFRMASLPTGPVTLSLQEEAASTYDWSSSEATALDTAPDTTLPSPFTVDPPGAPAVAEALYSTTDGSGVKAKAVVTWGASADVFARDYQVEYKLSSAAVYTVAGRTAATTLEVFDIAPGLYTFRVKALNHLGVSSAYSSNPAQIFGLTAPPADISGFSLNAINNNAHLSWYQASDLDVLVGGAIRIRYTPLTSGVSWSSASDLGPALPGVATHAVLPLLNGTYLIKAVDSAGNESVSPAVISSTVANIVKMNLVATSTQHSAFSGTKTNMIVVGSDLFDDPEDFDSAEMIDDGSTDVALQLDATEPFDDPEDFDGDEYFDAGTEGFHASGTYLFNTHIDVGKVTTSRVTALIDASVYDGLGAFDADDLFDGAGAFDGDDETAVVARLFVRTTDDNPAGAPAWSEWRQFFVGDYTCRAYQFKLEVTSSNGAYNIDVRQLSVTVDMPDVVDNGSLTTGTGGVTAVSFTRTFITTPAIGTTVKNGATGDFVELTSASSTGFSIGVKDSGGGYVARSVDWIARAY